MQFHRTGTVHGKTIVLDEPLPLPEGTPVEVTIVRAIPAGNSEADADEERAILEEVYRERGCGGDCEC